MELGQSTDEGSSWHRVAAGSLRVNGDAVIAGVRYIDVSENDLDSFGVAKAGARATDRTRWQHVAAAAGGENQDAVVTGIRNIDVAEIVQRHVGGLIQSGARTTDGRARSDVAI